MCHFKNVNSHFYARTAVALALLLASAGEAARGQDNAAPPIAKRESVEALEAKAAVPDRMANGPAIAGPTGTLSWFFLGPQPILNEYWSGNTNASGRVAQVVVDPTDPNTAYAATAGGGVWQTSDGGATWTPLTDQLSTLASGALAIDPSNPASLLYGTGEQNYSLDSDYGDGLFQSPDYGVTWTKIATRAQVGNYVARVGISSVTGVLHVCSDFGYLRSTDGGATWTQFRPGGWCNDLVRGAQTPSTWFAGFDGSGIYKSTDDGASWTRLAGGLPASGFQRINLGIADGNASVVYASLINPSGRLFGMYKTTNGGSSWSLLSATPNYVCTQGWYDNAVAVSPTDPNTVYAGGVFPYDVNCPGGVIKSTNGGASWTNVTSAGGTQVHPDQHSLTFGPDATLWVGCDGGVWKTTNSAASWINLNASLGTAQFYTVGIHSSDPNALIGGTQDNGSVQYQGSLGWPQIIGGDGGPVAWEWANPNLYYTTYTGMNPLYKWLSPITYQGDVTGPWRGERADWGNGPLVADQTLANTLLVGTYRVWQSTNSGGSWSLISPDLTGGGGGVLRALAVSPVDSNTVYSGSSDGRVFVTSNRGATWIPRSAGLPAGKTIPDIVADVNDPLTAYLCVAQATGGRLFQTTDGGISWQDLTGSLPAPVTPLSLTIDFNSGTFYLGTDFGVYSSADSGTTWTQQAINLPAVRVSQLRIDVTNGLIVAATHGRGMWEAVLGGGL
jgi:photosystem II stability/assembly factor-like uncharacterized protein